MPCGLRGWKAAPAILDFLFLGERVVDAGENLEVFLENACQLMRRRLALVALLLGQLVQKRLDPDLLALEIKLEASEGFIKQFVPSRGADSGLIVQEFLKFVRELIGFHRPHPVHDGAIAGKVGIGSIERFEVGIL